MTRGKIKTLTDRGFGFINMGQGNKDLFFHSRSLKGVSFEELNVGDELEFDIEDSEKGPCAVNVRIAEEV